MKLSIHSEAIVSGFTTMGLPSRGHKSSVTDSNLTLNYICDDFENQPYHIKCSISENQPYHIEASPMVAIGVRKVPPKHHISDILNIACFVVH